MAKTSDRIKEGLKLRGMKAIELSRKTGISSGMISEYMNDKYLPKQEKLYKIALALDVNESWLMGFDVSPGRNAPDALDPNEPLLPKHKKLVEKMIEEIYLESNLSPEEFEKILIETMEKFTKKLDRERKK